jgi:hypothetical protein
MAAIWFTNFYFPIDLQFSVLSVSSKSVMLRYLYPSQTNAIKIWIYAFHARHDDFFKGWVNLCNQNLRTFNFSLACQVANRPNMRRVEAENGFQACGLEASKFLR